VHPPAAQEAVAPELALAAVAQDGVVGHRAQLNQPLAALLWRPRHAGGNGAVGATGDVDAVDHHAAVAGTAQPGEDVDEGPLSATGHTGDTYDLPAAHLEVGDPVGTVRALSAKLGRHAELPALLADGAHQLRALTGFDRVILFRRNHDGIEQVAEDFRVSAPPAAIPSRLEESLRIICDSAASSVTLDPPADAGLLKGCILCGCSADEREAAKGNGAAASLMVPIRSGDVLWGAALCLNRLPRRPMLDRLAAAELFAELLAMRIEICELKGRGA